MKELKIDPELRDLLPPLTNEEYKQLEKNIVENGFDKNFPIMIWNDFVVDGHNRYSICKKHNIDFVHGVLAYETKEQVMEWMLDIQLGRRNLSPIQRISVAEKYRTIYEKQAKENMSLGGGDRKSDEYKKSGTPNLVEAINIRSQNETNTKLAKIAGVGKETYRMGAKILNSDNEDLKQRVLSGETAISAGYKELTNKNNSNEEKDNNAKQSVVPLETKYESAKPKVSEEVRQICEDLKTEKTQEYLESIWNYKVAIIDCMNADFETYFDGFASTLYDMENRVTKKELDECITNAENNIEKLLTTIELAKNLHTKEGE